LPEEHRLKRPPTRWGPGNTSAEEPRVIEALDVAITPAIAASREAPGLAVVIEVLRATSTIVTALDNGAAGVIPARDVDEALGIQRRLGRARTLLGGERESKLIDGFDLDNSPASYAPDKVNGKTVIFTTTNGSRALIEAARGTTLVLCAALLNRAAVAAAIAQREDEEAVIICAGNERALSFEDLLCAGALVDALQQMERHLLITDAARTALTVWQAYGSRITTAMASSAHAKGLVKAGFSADIATCARLDVSTCVPRYADGVIAKLGAAPTPTVTP
jgi:2-phosphosulfolactate phosphatase